VASRIDRVEREFIFRSAMDMNVPFRLHLPGRTCGALLSGLDRDTLRFRSEGGDTADIHAGESVNVIFGLHGQDFAFGTIVWRHSPRTFELRWPEAIYRSLSRNWPRVTEPAGLSAELLIPEGGPPEGYPRSADSGGFEQPECDLGLDATSLDRLVGSWKSLAAGLASTSRVRMLHPGDGPENGAEAIAARLGRLLFVPSTSGLLLPPVDPWGDGRLITAEQAENSEGIAALDGSSPLYAFIREKAEEGIASFAISPVVYVRSVVAFVHLVNGPERPRTLGLDAVELAWSFSRHLAWFLRKHGYFKDREGPRLETASVIDASPGGVQVGLGPDAPLLHPGACFDLRLVFPRGRLECKARVTRRVDAAGRCRYGLSLEELAPATVNALALGFYGRGEAHAAGMKA
jgi:hypothetical protein